MGIGMSKGELSVSLTSYDLKRLNAYANNMLDYHVILDMLPKVATHFFEKRLHFNDDKTSGETAADSAASVKAVDLSAVQKAILLGLGLQRKTVEDLEKELSLPVSQILALFIRIVRKACAFYDAVCTQAVHNDMQQTENRAKKTEVEVASDKLEDMKRGKRDIDDKEVWEPTLQSLEEDLDEGGRAVNDKFKQKQKELISSLDLSRQVASCKVIDSGEKDKKNSCFRFLGMPLVAMMTNGMTLCSKKDRRCRSSASRIPTDRKSRSEDSKAWKRWRWRGRKWYRK
jgi:N-acetyltransferase 10